MPGIGAGSGVEIGNGAQMEDETAGLVGSGTVILAETWLCTLVDTGIEHWLEFGLDKHIQVRTGLQLEAGLRLGKRSGLWSRDGKRMGNWADADYIS